MPPSRTGRLRGGERAWTPKWVRVETGDCAGVGADAGLGASVGSGLDGRAPPPMSSSAVHGRSSITSSRLSENRSSSPSSNMRCTCPPIAGINPRPVHDALLNAILFHPFEILMTSIIWNFPSGPVLDSCIPELAPKRGGAIRPSCLLVAGGSLCLVEVAIEAVL